MKRAFVLFCLLATPALAQSAIKPEDAAQHAGGSVTVEGIAHVYTTKSGMIFLDMGGSGKDSPFSAVIFAKDAGKFPHADAWNGKMVDVTGAVQMYQGKPEIIVSVPGQIVAK